LTMNLFSVSFLISSFKEDRGITNHLFLVVIAPLGCPVELGFRVQYSDLAMLGWVQLQVLAADNTVLIDALDNSTRESWDCK